MKLMGWLLSTHRRHNVFLRAFNPGCGTLRKTPDHDRPAKPKTFAQLSPSMEVRVRGRVKRERGYDYPELHQEDSIARLSLARNVLERQLQIH